MRIVFMGSPTFAVPTLKRLYQEGYSLLAVVTATDKPGGRNRQNWMQTAVKTAADELGIPVLQPTNLKDENFLNTLRELKPDLFVVVAFRMMPEVLWSLPPYGSINLHASLLPDYRGAAPINWAIIQGEKETGLSTFFIRKDIDTGPLIRQLPMPIKPEDNFESLHNRMMIEGAELVAQSLKDIQNPAFKPRSQEKASTKLAPKISHDTGCLDFSRSAKLLVNQIRGLSPLPGAWFHTKVGPIKILAATVVNNPNSMEADARIYSDFKSFILLKTAEGYLALDILQIPGKRPMRVKDFLNGNLPDWF